MQEYQELTPDAETFARVWKRVMPDESLSQIVVHTPEHQEEKKPPVSQPRAARAEVQPTQEGDEARLRRLLETLDEGGQGVGEILRRQPGAWPLREDLNKSAAQIRAAWLLLTGRRWNPCRQGRGRRDSLPRVLRDQYVWEIRFSQLCREAGAAMEREDLREIFPEQEEASRRRRRMLRHLLAGM